jgi:hypothetical protein
MIHSLLTDMVSASTADFTGREQTTKYGIEPLKPDDNIEETIARPMEQTTAKIEKIYKALYDRGIYVE